MNNHHNCHIEPIEKPLDEEALPRADFAYVAVSGMGCQTCATRVRNGLLRLNGVLAASIDLSYQIAAVTYDPARVSPADMITAIAETGDGRHHYQARLVASTSAQQTAPTMFD